MKNRLGVHILVSILTLLVLVLVGCEKERPVPTPNPVTPLPLVTVASTLPPPQTSLTQVVLSTQVPSTSGAQASQPTPVPVQHSSPTPPPPQPLAPTSQPAAAGSSGGEQYFMYTVALGDTLGGIAEKFGVSPDAVLALNPMADPDVLMVGQELKIPGEAPSESGGTHTYVVRNGDTLFSIALRFGVSVAELQNLNNIADEDQIYVGQELKIPATATVTTPTPPETYVVQSGDTLFSIALRYGVTTWALQVANDISDPNQIYVGQVLKIP